MENLNSLIPFTLFGSGIVFGILLIILFIISIVSDATSDGTMSAVAFVIAFILNYFWGTLPMSEIFNIKYISAYLLTGFVFSLIRTYFKGKELSPEQKKMFELKEHVFRWWLLFPFCIINWVFGRLLKDIYDAIYNKINSLYILLFNA